jgi:YVTN family beta-propeller protein
VHLHTAKSRLAVLGSLVLTAALATAGVSAVAPASAAPVTAPPGFRDVMWVGNNWAGTATVVDENTFEVLKAGVNLVPDKKQELRDITLSPTRLALFMLVRTLPGEGHDQFVDDMFTTPDGKHLAVSRPSLSDIVWIDIAKATSTSGADSITREQSMDGYRTDHMAVSPDGRRLLVSDSTKRQVIEYSMVDETVGGDAIKMGDRLRTFESGETPHESNYTEDGSQIFHASIGKVYTPVDDPRSPLHNAVKGDRWLQVVDNDDFTIAKRWDVGKELTESGHPHMSAAVRPMAVAPGERFVYFQVSFFHGVVEFDTQAPDVNNKVDYTLGGVPEASTGAVTRLIPLPKRTKVHASRYVNDSAHHGLAMNPAGTKLCAAGTMDDYVALVDRVTGDPTFFDEETTGHRYGKPYWSTEGLNNTCWVSLSDSDSVAVIDFETEEEIAYFPVGDHPQRVRHGLVPESVIATW